ncbi:lysylphosphatidylglycerol synthase domain-containing protein [Nocardiopsis gilva]|uniref:lysylphosphatidylglycerol synthase domain-containing protein n=1 Tax=Nocardiopsis gilva TaxID=280236 RepID=UPI00034A3F96|nr:lysylphosphatidylglycerol synthase domain-containing protein [Nocardiopsis gilva]
MLSRLRDHRWVRLIIVLIVLGCAGYALVARWDEAEEALRALSPAFVAASVAAALTGLGAQMMAWRAILADLGSPLPVRATARAMFVGQLGKYLPGSVWAFVAQVELAKDRDVARQRGITATVLAVAVTLTVNLAVAAATLPFASEEAAHRWWWVLACAPFLLAALHPRVVTWVIHTALRLVRRSRDVPDAELERVSGRGMAVAVGWSVLAWVPLGAHIWVLVLGAGGQQAAALPAAVGAYALAWTLGILFVIAPAGIGVRELVLVVALSPVLSPGSALVVAALSRLVMTAADILWAGAALAFTRSAAPSR